MTNPIPLYRYNYEALDALLKESIAPESCWAQLDEAMNVLATSRGNNSMLSAEQKANLYSDLRTLRDVFKGIKPVS